MFWQLVRRFIPLAEWNGAPQIEIEIGKSAAARKEKLIRFHLSAFTVFLFLNSTTAMSASIVTTYEAAGAAARTAQEEAQEAAAQEEAQEAAAQENDGELDHTEVEDSIVSDITVAFQVVGPTDNRNTAVKKEYLKSKFEEDMKSLYPTAQGAHAAMRPALEGAMIEALPDDIITPPCTLSDRAIVKAKVEPKAKLEVNGAVETDAVYAARIVNNPRRKALRSKIARWYSELFLAIYNVESWGLNGDPNRPRTNGKRKAQKPDVADYFDTCDDADNLAAGDEGDGGFGASQEPVGCMNASQPTIYIYWIKLANGMWYVGQTKNLSNRMRRHTSETMEGTQWLGKYPALANQTIGDQSYSLQPGTRYPGGRENAKVFEMMCDHGWQNVRGGSWSQINIKKSDKERLFIDLRHAKDLCIDCGGQGHKQHVCTRSRQFDEMAPEAGPA